MLQCFKHEKAMRDAVFPSYGCFVHIIQLIVSDGVLVSQFLSKMADAAYGTNGILKFDLLLKGLYFS